MGFPELKLRRWRERRGWTLQEVADLTGYSVSMLSRVERGESSLSPSAKVIVARRLGATVADLFDVEPVNEVAS